MGCARRLRRSRGPLCSLARVPREGDGGGGPRKERGDGRWRQLAIIVAVFFFLLLFSRRYKPARRLRPARLGHRRTRVGCAAHRRRLRRLVLRRRRVGARSWRRKRRRKRSRKRRPTFPAPSPPPARRRRPRRGRKGRRVAFARHSVARTSSSGTKIVRGGRRPKVPVFYFKFCKRTRLGARVFLVSRRAARVGRAGSLCGGQRAPPRDGRGREERGLARACDRLGGVERRR